MAATASTANGLNGAHGARPSPPFGDEPEQGIWACGGTPLPAQLWAVDSGAAGGRFGQDGLLDGMPAGAELGLLLPTVGDVADLDDGELPGVIRGWRRMESWAAAMEHAAVAELVRRRIAEAEAAGARGDEVPRYAAAEVAAALRLTSCSADGLMGRAISLAGLPATWAALAAGQIDVPKALVILNGMSCLRADLAGAVEAQVVPAAAGQTTGELRKAVAQAVIAADPAAADQRVAEAQKSARVERWAEPSGTAAIAGRDLPPGEVLAADNRVSALAAALKADGAPGGIDLLRAQVFLGLLLGRPVAAPAAETRPGAHQPAHHQHTPEQHPTAEDGSTCRDGPVCRDGCSAERRHIPAGLASEDAPPIEQRPIPEDGVAGDGDVTGESDLAAAGVLPTSSDVRAGDAASAGRLCGAEGVEVCQVAAAGQPSAAAGLAGSVGPAGSADDREPIPGELRRVAAGPPQERWAHPPGGWAGMAGSVNLTVPLRSLLGQSSTPGEVAGFGPLSPSVTSELLAAARYSPAVRWCVTVTDADGRAAGHGCAAGATVRQGEPGGWGFTLTVRALETGDCGHARESAAYEPPPMLRHLIQTRHRTCAFPGCGRPARRCDADHTIAYGDGGRTCECNLAPLCRFHHKVKQAQGWQLTQSRPGMLQWVTPSGWRYTITPGRHPI